MGPHGTWVYHSTKTYTLPAPFTGFSGSGGVMTITVKNDGGNISQKVTCKKGPEPKPDLKKGEDLFSQVESYMYDELTRNARSDDMKMIQGLLRPWAWYDGLVGRDKGSDTTAALSMWGAKVCPKGLLSKWVH
ncbi:MULTISPECIES: hypothetical protein [unclassified Streptomyces]|uniref:hypothetical protein n=1 Tax=unclassified Streptomyces TaxID=2593676 RepID=UPI00081D733B|nr:MULTISPECIES: hypothetical protein [unclassified Streptomyces]MYZ35099.1 hypothetical protein [Streptomyces sp. SID4917]SCF72722.1 hypothetical protein GA0115259_101647 [Streptomyces sp. MnatMP-M17]